MGETNTDLAEAFREAYPDDYLDGVEEISEMPGSGSDLSVRMKDDKTISPSITVPLLEAGFAVTSLGGGNNIYYSRVTAETRTVEKTVITTED